MQTFFLEPQLWEPASTPVTEAVQLVVSREREREVGVTLLLSSSHLILLQIHSNHGNADFTCLYRFRVHGFPAPSTGGGGSGAQRGGRAASSLAVNSAVPVQSSAAAAAHAA
jgi:hypothetical protein